MDKKIIKKKWSIKSLGGIGILVMSLSFLLYSYLNGNSEKRLTIKRDRIKVFTVESNDFREFISIRGNVLPKNTIYLDAVEGGRIEEIFVEDGAFLDSGDAILRLDNANLLMDIMNREAEFYEQQNNLRNTRLSLEQNKLKLKNDLIEFNYNLINNERLYLRNKELYQNKHISFEDYIQSKNNFDYMKNKRDITLESQQMDSIFRISQISQLERSLGRMEENLSFVKQKLENLVVKAPASGQLSALNAEIGESKVQGSRLGQIDIISSYKIEAPIDEYYLNKISLGKQGSFVINNKTYFAEIGKIYPEITNGSFKVELKIDKEITDLRRGQTLIIDLELSQAEKSLVVSRDGFYNETGGKWIYKLNNDENVATKQEIKLGRQNPKYFEVNNGISEGDKVIVSSYTNFKGYDVLILE